MSVRSHTAAWYDRLAARQAGYYYPWQSRLGMGNGEDAYLALVPQMGAKRAFMDRTERPYQSVQQLPSLPWRTASGVMPLAP